MLQHCQPELFEEVRRLLDTEIEGIRRRSGGTLTPQEAGAPLAFVVGSLVMGAFAPRRVAGFAGPAARRLAGVLGSRPTRSRA